MQAKALICDSQQHFALADVSLPEPGPDGMVVRTLYSGVSIGTEFALVRGKLDWGPYPICTGYQAAGVVERVGERVEGFSIGQRVYFRLNAPMQLADGQRVSPACGAHCSHGVITAQNLGNAGPLPEGVSAAAAGMVVMPAVGLFGVDTAGVRMGDVVVVYGCGLIGLGVVAACSHRGAVVMAADIDDKRLEMARKLGADVCVNSKTQDLTAELKAIADENADVVFECTGLPECVDPAIELCRREGKFVFQGNYGKDPISWHFLPAHGKRLTMFFPSDDGQQPCRRAVLKNMAAGVLPWEETITHCVKAKDAPDLFASINTGRAKDVIGAVIDWS